LRGSLGVLTFAELNENIIAKDKLHIDKLKIFFKEQKNFETKDIAIFFKEFEPDISQTTINWRIYTLVKQGILKRIGKGIFTLGAMNYFVPEISSKAKSLNKKIKKDFPYLELCIWNSSLLNEFTLHQANQFYLLIEVEKEATQAIFLYLCVFLRFRTPNPAESGHPVPFITDSQSRFKRTLFRY